MFSASCFIHLPQFRLLIGTAQSPAIRYNLRAKA